MTPKEACAEWARIVRAVAAGELPPAEALARRPVVGNEDVHRVPSAFWSVRDMLETEVQDDIGGMLKVEGLGAHFADELRKLADRIEGKSEIP